MRLIYLLLLTSFLISCSSSTVYIPASKVVNAKIKKVAPVSGESCGFQLLVLIPIGINSRQRIAYYEMVAQAQGNPVSSISMEESWYYGLVGTGYCTKFTGIVKEFEKEEAKVQTANFEDIVVLSNGTILSDVKTVVTEDSIVVISRDGTTTVYKKNEVLSIKKK